MWAWLLYICQGASCETMAQAVLCPTKGDCISYTHNEQNGVGFSQNGIELIDGLYIIITTTAIVCANIISLPTSD